MYGDELAMASDAEQARGIELPLHMYSLFEDAIRRRRSETHDVHRDRIAQLWSGLNSAAVANPYAWSRRPMSAQQIREPGPGNRMVAFPYTKAMCSNWDVDQAAAVIVCSAQAADDLGVPRDRWVFPHLAAEAQDTAAVTNRWELGRSPAIARAWRCLAEEGRVDVDDLEYVDLYSCFPSAVQAAAEAIGLDESRALSVTGGLPFAGGPLNNYVMHSIATMVGVLRDDTAARGLVTANGGFLTKHALAVYSATPPAAQFRRVLTPAGSDDDTAIRALARDHSGPVTIEAGTVLHDHDGPQRALFALLDRTGRRTWGVSEDQAIMQAVSSGDDLVGPSASLSADGRVELG
jgi:acetyl-CoA C-acetyltransferase